jgi:hypothetical protein
VDGVVIVIRLNNIDRQLLDFYIREITMLGELIQGVKKLSDAINLIEENGVMYPYELLKELGYKVRWAGLSVDDSTIEANP